MDGKVYHYKRLDKTYRIRYNYPDWGSSIPTKGGSMREIELYQTEDGKIPLHDFFGDLEKKHRAKVFRDIDLLEEYGTELTQPQVEHVEGKLWELRTKLSRACFQKDKRSQMSNIDAEVNCNVNTAKTI